MQKILITGGTTFVSKYTASYFVQRGYEVYVLNRGNKEQVPGVHLLKCDRHDSQKLQKLLSPYSFDAVLDITSYKDSDINDFVPALGNFRKYIMVSSSAVYPETEKQPFVETARIGENKFWHTYGTDKIAAEKALLNLEPEAYIVRPPYLYGPMNNVYREAFVFDCAMKGRSFYLPKDGSLKLHFFMVEDLCRFFESILNDKNDERTNSDTERIFNVGNEDCISIRDWVSLCYAACGKVPEFIEVHSESDFRKFFPFYDYEYKLDVSRQKKLLPSTMPLEEEIRIAFDWYKNKAHQKEVNKKPYFDFIDNELLEAEKKVIRKCVR